MLTGFVVVFVSLDLILPCCVVHVLLRENVFSFIAMGNGDSIEGL